MVTPATIGRGLEQKPDPVVTKPCCVNLDVCFGSLPCLKVQTLHMCIQFVFFLNDLVHPNSYTSSQILVSFLCPFRCQAHLQYVFRSSLILEPGSSQVPVVSKKP